MTSLGWGLIAGCGVSLVALVFSDLRRWPAGVWVFKTLASLLFVAAAFANGAWDTPVGRAIAVGLALGAVGDVLLIPADPRAFLAGLVAFLGGHVLYGVAFVLRGVDAQHTALAGAVMLVPAIVVGRWLLPHVEPKMKVPVLVYMAVITAMVALGYGTLALHGAGGTLLLGAAIAFYASDLCVARDRFVKRGPINRVLGLPLYYGAQVAFALAVT